MKNLLNRLFSNKEQNISIVPKIREEGIFKYKDFKKYTDESHKKQYEDIFIKILPTGKWCNSRDDYIELKGVEESAELQKSVKYGMQDASELSKYFIKLKTFTNGEKSYVISGRKEIVTSKGNPDGRLHSVVENPGHKIEYDTVLKFLDESPIESMFFLNENYIFIRFGSPSMCGFKPKDLIQDPTHHKDSVGDSFIVHSGNYSSYNQLELAKPLIKTMEQIIGKTIVNDKYFGYIEKKDIYNTKITNAWKFLRSDICW